MKKRSERSAELFIYSEIDSSGYYGISDKDVVQALNEVGDIDQLDIRINSGGGDVFAGMAIYEAIRRFPAKKTVYVDGLAASAASVIAMAGDERFISSGGFFMIHRASGGVYGTDEDMRAMANVLADISERIAVIYNERTGQDLAELRNMVTAETWMNSDKACELGFATGRIQHAISNLISPTEIDAKLENASRAFSNSLKAMVNPPPALPAALPPEELPRQQADHQQQAPVSAGAFSLSNSERTIPMNREARIRERIENATIAMEQIQNAADQRGDDLSSSEVAQITEINAEIATLRSQLSAVEAVNSAKAFVNAPQDRKGADPVAAAAPIRVTPGLNAANTSTHHSPLKGNGRFTNGLAEFAKAVMENVSRGVSDTRLDAIRNAETSFGTGSEGPAGGYAIPDDFRKEIYSNAIEQDPLLSRARSIPTQGRSVTLSTRETQPWQTGNVQAYSTGEGEAITRSLYAMNQVKIELHKTAALIFASEELLEDAPALANEIVTVGAEQLNFKLTNQIIRGSGVNEMLGILNAPALATVAKESAGGAQTADTIVVENINNMYAAMPPRNRNNAVWLVAPNAEPQIWKAAFHAPSGADPIGRAPGTMPNQPFGTLYGRPVIPHEVCNELGDLGDIFFLDMSDYALPMKQGGIQTATSMHFAFDQQLQAFRMTIRAGGAPLWRSTIASRDGSFVRSPFVALQAR